ncbi:MAG: AAA family ATPase [Terrimicrobiaceae bacterium]
MSIQNIDPLLIAEKLDLVRNFLLPEVQADLESEPRLVKAIWFLQWISMPENYAGGINRFALDLIERYSSKIGPETIQSDSKMTIVEIERFLKTTPQARKFYPRAHAMWEGAFFSSTHGLLPEEEELFERTRLEEISKLTADGLHEICIDSAKENLSDFLHDVCTNSETRPLDSDGLASRSCHRLWYFPRLWECLFDFMDHHTETAGGRFAETSITREIFHWLRTAQDTRKGVMFLGHSRFGKSHAIRAYARMHPWSVRLVECPSSGSESDLLREICRALGIRFKSATPPMHEQRTAIDKVIRSARFLLIFDEAQMLYPQNGSRRTAPPRLNYVRRQIMDIGIPTAFIATIQSWRHVEQNYLKFSGFAQEQFEGRLILSPIHLPSELSEAEMLEVARVHLPELDSDYLMFLVAPIRACKGDHLSYIENIALISRRYASQRGISVPQLEDLKKAISDVLGCFQAPEQANPAIREVSPAPARRSASHRPRQISPLSPSFDTPARRENVPAGFRQDSADLPELAVTV